MNQIAFDSEGKVMERRNLNGDKLPTIGKKIDLKFMNIDEVLIKSSFQDFKAKLQEMKNKRVVRGVNLKDNDKDSTEGKLKRRLKGALSSLNLDQNGPDKHALGLVESGGSFFNSFKPCQGVTIIESNIKIKKGEKFKPNKGSISRLEYSKSYSQKPIELKGILTNSQSVGNLNTKKNNGISFYEEGSLPPIMSPSNRYKQDRDEEITKEFELDQSAIPMKRTDENIIRGSDITELVNFDRSLLDDTQYTNDYRTARNAPISVLPKYVNR
jgi:hypothetical protein